jgi:hypothetical protein
MNLTSLSENVTTQGGVSIPQKITKLDAVVFSTLLMKCLSLDVGRKLQKDRKLDNAEFDTIRRFCIQAIKDVHHMEQGKQAEGFTPKKGVTA